MSRIIGVGCDGPQFRPRWVSPDRPAPTIVTDADSDGGRGWLLIDHSEDDVTTPDEAGAKPPYRVPTMKEIAALPWNGLTVVSTFAGCGGSSLGYRMAGYRVLWANEFVPAAADTYEANKAPYTVVDRRDIRTLTAADVLAATGGIVPDILDGSPPCASFSTAGRREAGWGKVRSYSDTKQRTDDLFFEYTRLLRELRPRVFVAENVSGLVKGTAKGYFLEILAAMRDCGYRVSARLLDAQWLGVPQARQRLIFVGVRDDLGVEPSHPAPLPYRYSVRDALPQIARIVYPGGTGYNKGKTTVVGPDGISPTVEAHGYFGDSLSGKDKYYVEAMPDPPAPILGDYAIGAEWDKLAPGEQSDKYFNLVRADPDRPISTVTAAGGNPSAASVTHPYERRKFTIAELRRLCSFPDDFALTGTYTQQWERLGRAVPPVMMRAVAANVADAILTPLGDRGRAGPSAT